MILYDEFETFSKLVNSEFYNDFKTFSKLVHENENGNGNENENLSTNKILRSLEILAIKNICKAQKLLSVESSTTNKKFPLASQSL